MEIKLKIEDESVRLTDEELDNDNFVGVAVGDSTVDVDLDELVSAVQAFQQKRVMRVTRENKYQDNF